MADFPQLATALPIAAAALTAGTLAYGTFAPASSLFGPIVSHGPRSGPPAVSLTFDDGPWPGSTDVILDILQRENIRATFFVIGRFAAAHPALLRRIHDEGHLLGNHTYDHSRLGMFRGPAYWQDQINRTGEILRQVTGDDPPYFRPPMGMKSPLVMRAARRCRRTLITWSRRGFDGVRTTPASIVQRLARSVPGDILLLHDGRDPASRRPVGATAAALPEIIAALRGRGLDMLRVDELLTPRPAPAQR